MRGGGSRNVTGEVPTERVPAQVRTVGASLCLDHASVETDERFSLARQLATCTRDNVVNEQM